MTPSPITAPKRSIDGGSGTNTLVLRAAATVNLGSADQTSGDSTNVTNFQNVDGSALSSALTFTGSSGNNTITGGSGNDTIDGGGGARPSVRRRRRRHLHRSTIVAGCLARRSTAAPATTRSTSAANSGTISDTELVASLTNIQSIDFTASNVNASLNLSGSQISQMDGGAANTLTMLTNAGIR